MQVHGMYIRNKHDIIGYEQTGCVMSMTANRLSFFYSFRGPSKTCEPLKVLPCTIPKPRTIHPPRLCWQHQPDWVFLHVL